MDVTLHQLRMLREVARRGTIAAAADELGYSPSAVSQQLAAVERTTGVAMLERVGRNVLLTDAGREMVHHAEAILERVDIAEAAIQKVTGGVAGTLRLGFIESVALTMLGPLMEVMAQRHPELELRTVEVDGSATEEMVARGELDVAFTVFDPNHPAEVRQDLEHVVILRDWFKVVVPSTAEVEADVVDLADLDGRAIVGPPAVHSCGMLVTQMCRRAGFEPNIVHTVSDYTTTLRLVSVGAGAALIPDLGLQQIPAGTRVLELKEPTHREVAVLFRRSSSERPAIRAVVDALENVADELGFDRPT